MASTRPKRNRRPSTKIAFLDTHSEQWAEHAAALNATKSERKRKRMENKKAREATTTKKAKKKAKKAKGGKVGPKKPLSAYMFFAMETRAEVIEEFPSANFGEVAQILGEWWQDCTPSEKRKYQRMHEKDKARYARECGGHYVPKTFKAAAKKSTTKRKRRAAPAPAPAPAAKKVTSYFDMAKEAIKALKSRKGSSQQAIEKYILSTFVEESQYKRHHLRKALKKNHENGRLVKVRSSYKLSAAEKSRR